MSNFFKKLSNNASYIFTKVDKGASDLFTNSAPNIASQISSKIQIVGDKIAGVGEQAILGDVAGSAAIATGFGAPLGASLISAGNIGQQMGQRLKQGSQQIRDASNKVGNLVQSQVQNASNQALMAKIMYLIK